MLIDLHSHIVPGVDDGAATVNESVALLELLKKQNVGAVLATPHFSFHHGDPELKRAKIAIAYDQLKRELAERELPEVFLGYEVAYFRGISRTEEITRYTLGGTDRILIELPMEPVTDEMVNEIVETAYNFRLVPILAHLERYSHCPGYGKILSLLDEGDVLAQVTASAVNNRGERRALDHLADDGYVSFVGSDAHSTAHRPPEMTDFVRYAREEYGREFLDRLSQNNDILYDALRDAAQKER